MSQLNICEATRADADVISRLIVESTREGIGPTLSPAGLAYLLSAMTVARNQARLDSGEFQFFVGKLDARPVAVSALRLPCHLYYLFVDSAYQNRGFGRQLWQHVRDWMQSSPGRCSDVTVNASLNSVAVYKRLGFVARGPQRTQHDVKFQPMVWHSSR